MVSIEHSEPMSARELAVLGVQDVAYVKPIRVEGETAYGIYAADGTQLAQAPNRDVAFVIVRQNHLEPVSVH